MCHKEPGRGRHKKSCISTFLFTSGGPAAKSPVSQQSRAAGRADPSNELCWHIYSSTALTFVSCPEQEQFPAVLLGEGRDGKRARGCFWDVLSALSHHSMGDSRFCKSRDPEKGKTSVQRARASRGARLGSANVVRGKVATCSQ